MQLPVWCSILASVIMWHQRFSSCLPVEYRIKYKLCALMHQIHTGRAPQYLVDCAVSRWIQPYRPGLRCYVKQVSFKKFFESIGVSSELNAGRQLDQHDWNNVHQTPYECTTSNAALVRSLVNVASVMLVRLPGTLYLPALSSLLTPIDSKNFLKLTCFT